MNRTRDLGTTSQGTIKIFINIWLREEETSLGKVVWGWGSRKVSGREDA